MSFPTREEMSGRLLDLQREVTDIADLLNTQTRTCPECHFRKQVNHAEYMWARALHEVITRLGGVAGDMRRISRLKKERAT